MENYHYHFEGKTEEEYLAYAKEFMRLCDYADIQLYGELLVLKDWVAENYKFPY